MKHAILIMAHNNFSVLETLLQQLDSPEFDIFIHINARIASFPQEQLSNILTHNGGQLTWVPRVRVRYCDYSMVEAVISLFRTAVKTYHDYYHVISGVDLLTKKRKDFLDFFEENNGKEFVGFSSAFEQDRVFYRNYFVPLCRQKSHLFSLVFIKIRKGLIKLQKVLGFEKTFPANMFPHKGTDWYSITHEAACKLLELEPSFRKYYYHAYCPSEFFPHTILGNSPAFKRRLYSPEQKENIQCARTIDWERGTPYIFREPDFDELVNAPGVFARKFDENVDMKIVERLKSYVLLS